MWVELEHSKKSVRRAGDYLIADEDFNVDKFLENYYILENWRGSHAYPMKSMLGYFRNKALEVDSNALVVQRLKRTPSIFAKLRREQGMKLDRIEDLGGCRIIVANKKEVYAVKNAIIDGRTRNILRRERDYIKTPKQSGYRGIHLVYQYNGAKLKFKTHKIELQIRSKVQHSWATAVEVVGAFTGQALKASSGRDSWLNFFKSASTAFEDIENKALAKNAQSKERLDLIKYINRLGVISRLKAFAVSTRHLGKRIDNKDGYYLLTLEIDKSNIKISRYSKDQLDIASKDYSDKETEFKENTDKDVVLVAASSIHNLKKAYPNYFADTTEFTRQLSRIIEANNAINSDS